jgi:Zn-dependent peptidase ImmA (M78 family)
MKPKHKFECPGIHHALIVKIISQKQMDRFLRDKGTLGCYIHEDGLICLTKELTSKVKEHTLFHEIGHHIRDTLRDVKDEETKCDILGSYLMKLLESKEHILKELAK